MSAPIVKNSFVEYMLDFNKYGYTLVSLVLGFELGIFDVLKNAEKPLTSTEIADLAVLKERYVREWLGAVSAAEVITTHVTDDEIPVCRYSLSEEHYNTIMATVSFGRGVFACGNRIELIKSCFRKHGPLGDPDAFGMEFHTFFGDFRNKELIKTVHREIFPHLENVTNLQERLEMKGCNVLDVGCGTGAITTAFAKRYPSSFFTGLDVTEDTLTQAKGKLDNNGIDVSNLFFKHRNSEALFDDIVDASIDVIMMFQVLHNLPDPLKMIEDVNKILKPGGKLILLEMSLHSNHADNTGSLSSALQYTISQFFCLPFSMSNKPHVGYGMGWGEEEMLKAVGRYFTLDANFQLQNLEGLFCLTKKTPL